MNTKIKTNKQLKLTIKQTREMTGLLLYDDLPALGGVDYNDYRYQYPHKPYDFLIHDWKDVEYITHAALYIYREAISIHKNSDPLYKKLNKINKPNTHIDNYNYKNYRQYQKSQKELKKHLRPMSTLPQFYQIIKILIENNAELFLRFLTWNDIIGLTKIGPEITYLIYNYLKDHQLKGLTYYVHWDTYPNQIKEWYFICKYLEDGDKNDPYREWNGLWSCYLQCLNAFKFTKPYLLENQSQIDFKIQPNDKIFTLISECAENSRFTSFQTKMNKRLRCPPWQMNQRIDRIAKTSEYIKFKEQKTGSKSSSPKNIKLKIQLKKTKKPYQNQYHQRNR